MEVFEFNSSMFFLALLPLLLSSSASAQPEFFNVSCYSNNATYNPNSQYDINLRSLLGTLALETPQNQGFYSTSSGNGLDRVHGRALCRGDITPAVCKSCVESAGGDILNRCRTQGAIIWYDMCQIEYSYALHDGYAGRYTALNSDTASDHDGFCNALRNLIASLRSSAGSSKLMYATEKIKYSTNEILYGLVQCTRDITRGACDSCLDSAFQDLDACQNYKGDAVLSNTCNVRIGLHQFYSEPRGNGHRFKVILSISVVVVVLSLVAVLIGLYLYRRRKTNATRDEEHSPSPDISHEEVVHTPHVFLGDEAGAPSKDLPFMEFSVIRAATENFSDSNKLGKGGFGTVYKGMLPDGKAVAIKRLSGRSWQGSVEFMNEIKIIAKLQHRNLVRLLSCGMEGNEKLLVYEYMPNKSLDIFLFDDEKRWQLDWEKRINIIKGIARGLVYLHEESRLKIVHRDLKPGNVLLDQDMNARISDFGMARIFCDNQKLANTKRVVGTYGYMAPEYAMEGLFSVKSDVFSFGVLLMEIISGKRNSGFHVHQPNGQTLLAHAWRVWNEGREVDLVDPALLRESGSESSSACPAPAAPIMEDARRCIHIGLLCVQEDPSERPTMSQVVMLLESSSSSSSRLQAALLPEPNKPAGTGRPAAVVSFNIDDGSSCLEEDVKDPSVNEVSVSSITPR